MALSLDHHEFIAGVRGIVMRPHGLNAEVRPQVLVFFKDCVHELICATDVGGDVGIGTRFVLSKQPLPIVGTLNEPACIVYEPISDSVVYTNNNNNAIMRLDSNNTISLVAGCATEKGSTDGRGEAARFIHIIDLAADGKGNIFVADFGLCTIRLLRVNDREVITLPGVNELVTALTYDTVTDVLVATTSTAVLHVALYGATGHGCGLAAAQRLVTGSLKESGNAEDETLGAARFQSINSVLAAADGGLFILESQRLRFMDPAADKVTAYEGDFGDRRYRVSWLAILPGGQLVFGVPGQREISILTGDRGFKPSSEVLAGWRRAPGHASCPPQLPASFLEAPGGKCGDASNGEENPIVTVRVAGGRAFLAHRSVLAARSDYFRQRLAAGGGFVDSGGAEVILPEAHPEAFGCLLLYMYGGELRVPKELLRPAAELTGMLLMPGGYATSQLQQQMLESVTPETVVSELVWAERHNLTELVPQLNAFLMKHRRQVAAAGPRVRGELMELMALNPGMAAEIMLGLASA